MNNLLTTRLITKYILILTLSIILFTSTCFGLPLFAGGEGTCGNPYQISTVDQLKNIELNLSAYYVLINDIDASSTSSWNSGAGFEPIGNDSNQFSGSFDGQGHNITGLFIDRPSQDDVGLFGYTTSQSKIENTGLVDQNVTGSNNVGGLVGYNFGDVSYCYATGTVTGSNNAGGLVGYNKGTLNQCYTTGTATGRLYVGGLVGVNNDAVTQCYTTSNVSGSAVVGGLVGGNNGIINDCYSTGPVNGSVIAGGLVGDNNGDVNYSYWDTETSGFTTSDGGYGKNTTGMKTQLTYVNWNFTDIWDFCNDITGF